MTISQYEALQKIMEIVAMPGEEVTDGECLDMIIFVLEELGMPVHEHIDKARTGEK